MSNAFEALELIRKGNTDSGWIKLHELFFQKLTKLSDIEFKRLMNTNSIMAEDIASEAIAKFVAEAKRGDLKHIQSSTHIQNSLKQRVRHKCLDLTKAKELQLKDRIDENSQIVSEDIISDFEKGDLSELSSIHALKEVLKKQWENLPKSILDANSIRDAFSQLKALNAVVACSIIRFKHSHSHVCRELKDIYKIPSVAESKNIMTRTRKELVDYILKQKK